MRIILQRVSSASVSIEGAVVGSIGKGLLILLGITHEDTPAAAKWLAQKVAALRCFNDEAGKMNLSVQEVGGACLVVSQFTLYGECSKGNRPSYIKAARPELAEPLYEQFSRDLAGLGIPVANGRFGAMMEVALVNDGPVTMVLESPAAIR